MSTTDKTTTSTPTTTVPNWDELPCVQYGFPEDKGPTRAPKLRTIFEPIPDDATTASPVYVLTRDQYDRQQRFESGYEVKEATSIATELQDECEADGRVLYPIHIESDAYHEEGPAALIGWFREFVRGHLDVPFHTCTLYFSGHRSIHVHVPRFVSGEDQRERLKQMAETFCEETGAELDCGLYYAKRLFRLPGVKHRKTGLRKVKIQPEWDHSRIFRESNTASVEVPNSYQTVLRRVFIRPSRVTNVAELATYTPYDLFRVLDSDKTVLTLEQDEQAPPTPLIEQTQYPGDSANTITWLQYNAKEFSPYALAAGNERSVAAIKVQGGAFARKEVRNGTVLVPAYFYGARGCAGEEFTKDDEHAPLQLSDRDYAKWDYQEGDHVVIIGGQSRNSRLLRVDSWQATVVGHALTSGNASRQAALDFLRAEGYDVGSAGSSGSATPTRHNTRPTATRIWPARRNPGTPAEALQRQAEQNGIETLSHTERGQVACRVLRYGWDPAWEWFKKQFESEFKPIVTWEQFQSIIASYPDDYCHVEVPPKPS